MTTNATKRIPTHTEREDILRALTAWTQNPVAADDLTQQTMLEAWKSDRQPPEAEWRPWLFGIARNMFYRWRRDLARDLRRTIAMPENDAVFATVGGDTNLHTPEIISLLQEMLDDLPEETRQALLLKYIEDLPQTEVAKRLGVSEKALESRLLRGKRKLRDQVIMYRPDTAIDLGLVVDTDTWHTTTIWCLSCGRERLEARWFEDGTIRYDCPRCQNELFLPGERINQITHHIRGGIPVNPPSFSKMYTLISRNSGAILHGNATLPVRCIYCDRPIAPRRWRPDIPEAHPLTPDVQLDVVYVCEPCQAVAAFQYLPSIGLSTRQGDAFLQRHPQVHMRMPVATDWQGRPAVQQTWKSINDPGEFTCWVDTESFLLLDIMIDGELQ